MDQRRETNSSGHQQLVRCSSVSGDAFSTLPRKSRASRQGSNATQASERTVQFPLSQDATLSIIKSAAQQQDEQPPPKRPRFNTCFHHFRFVMVVLAGMSAGMMMLLRYNITYAILRMVNQTHLYLEENPNRTIDDFVNEGFSLATGEFNWNNEIQQMIMSWYMIAYTIPQIPAARFGVYIGSRLAVPISLTICVVSTLLTPTFAYYGWQYVILLRMTNAIGASGILPQMMHLIETWLPPDQITLGLTIVQIIINLVLTMIPFISCELSSIHWSYAFYYPSLVTFIFTVLFMLLVTDDPNDNILISEKELQLISQTKMLAAHQKENETKNINSAEGGGDSKSAIDKSEYIPSSVLQIFTLPSFYAFVVVWCLYCNSLSGFMFILPTYLRQFLKVSIDQNGFYCSLVQLGAIVSVIWPHPVLKFLEKRFSRTTSARVTYTLVCIISFSTFFYVALCHNYQVLVFFILRSFQSAGDVVVVGSLLQNYSVSGLGSTAYSIVNTVGNLSIVPTSTFFGWLLDYTAQSRGGWTVLFSGLGVAQLLLMLLYVTFVTSDPVKFKNTLKKKEEAAKKKAEAEQL